MRHGFVCAALAMALPAAPALAAQDKPITNNDPTLVDAAKTPVTDLNLDKQEIPQVLMNAQIRPYEMAGLGKCPQLIAAVNELDDVLGPDLDLPQEVRDRLTAGRAAKALVGMFIPFRGLIREVSGANAHERAVQAAIQAGLARRGFLKGVGLSKRCAYPGRPATKEVIDKIIAEREAAEAAEAAKKEAAGKKDTAAVD